jgi:hypothetical protein
LELIKHCRDSASLDALIERVRKIIPQLGGESDLVFLHRFVDIMLSRRREERAVIEDALVVLCSINAAGYIIAMTPSSKAEFKQSQR